MLPLLIDENLNHRILRGLLRSVPHLDDVLASSELKGATDLELLDFAGKEKRVVVTHDLRTFPKFAYERLKAGLAVPGVIAVGDHLPLGQVIEDLHVLVECADPPDLQSLVIYLPL